MKKIMMIVLLLLVSSVQATSPTDPATIFETELEVHWQGGFQTSHYMFGPLPGAGVEFVAGTDWYYALRGATAQAVDFYFNYPTQHADKVSWRIVWCPNWVEVRLVAAYALTPGTSRTQVEVVELTPFTSNAQVQQDITHNVAWPRVVDVDVTDFFNSTIDAGGITQYMWEVRQGSGQ